MNYMFQYCPSLVSLPDISKWNINKVSSKWGMFEGCNKELNIPNKFKEK